jgi:hypothetical protein
MTSPQADKRSPGRRAQDEQIAVEPHLAQLDVPSGAISTSMEARLPQPRRPWAVVGVVENGLVRPLDPAVELPEHARVIIVASDRT